jgi:hypothetical protein
MFKILCSKASVAFNAYNKTAFHIIRRGWIDLTEMFKVKFYYKGGVGCILNRHFFPKLKVPHLIALAIFITLSLSFINKCWLLPTIIVILWIISNKYEK